MATRYSIHRQIMDGGSSATRMQPIEWFKTLDAARRALEEHAWKYSNPLEQGRTGLSYREHCDVDDELTGFTVVGCRSGAPLAEYRLVRCC